MAAEVEFKLDHGGIAELLVSAEIAALVAAKAEEVAGNVRAADTIQRHAAPVEVEHYVTDRAAAAVVIKHAGARAMQAKYGVLTQAAAAAGLEVHGR